MLKMETMLLLEERVKRADFTCFLIASLSWLVAVDMPRVTAISAFFSSLSSISAKFPVKLALNCILLQNSKLSYLCLLTVPD